MRYVLLLIVAFVTAPLVAQTLPKKQLVEEVRLDATAEDFPDVSTVMVSRRGEMAVVVGKDQQFRFYDATGKKLGTFGRVGSGPGEFRGVNWFGWTSDTIWVFDTDLRRLTYIGPDHKLLRNEVLSGSLSTMLSRGSAAASDGEVMLFWPRAIVDGKYIGTAVVAAGKTPDGRTNSKMRTMVIPRVAIVSERSGQLTPASDSIRAGPRRFLAPDPPPFDANTMRWMPADGRGSASMVVPFTFAPVTAYSSDGGRIGFLTVEPTETGGTYTLKVMKTTGEPIFTRAYPFVGIPIARNVTDSVFDGLGLRPDGTSMFQPPALAKFKDEVKGRMPKFYSPVSQLHMNRDNTAWIQMRRSNPQAKAVVVLIDERGNQLATFDLPPRTRIVQATRDQIWAVVTDEDDLPSVVRFRVK